VKVASRRFGYTDLVNDRISISKYQMSFPVTGFLMILMIYELLSVLLIGVILLQGLLDGRDWESVPIDERVQGAFIALHEVNNIVGIIFNDCFQSG
jgi:hypothetical protein